MSSFQLDKMTWEDIGKLDRNKTIFFLPVSPMEEHGPHLPLGTDFFGAKDIAELAIRKLNEKDPTVNYVLIPGVPLGCAEMTMDFPGTISMRGKTLMRIVYDIGSSLARHGFKYLLISNHHLVPIHVKALLVAARKLERKCGMKVFEPISTIIFSDAIKKTRLAKAGTNMGVDMETESHADIKETSFIKHKYPELLRDCYKDLSPCIVDIRKFFKRGIRKLKKMGAEKGYLGSPAEATSELGQIHLEEGAEILVDSAEKLYKGEELPQMSKEIRFALKFLVRLN